MLHSFRLVIAAIAGIFCLSLVPPGSPSLVRAAGQPDSLGTSSSFVRPLTGGLTGGACGDGVQANGEICFHSPVLVTSTSSDPNWIETGYINGGPNLDFVASVTDSNSIRIKLGSGDGTFGGTYTWSMGTSPIGVKLADFNGDGLTDIIAARYPDDQIRIRWGHSNWSTYSNYTTDNGPITVDVADLNGDGLDDFVTAGLSLQLTVRLRQGGGGFTSDSYSGLSGGYFILLGDCNNDGHPDLIYPAVSGGGWSRMAVRLNDGTGSFGAAQLANTGNNAEPLTLFTVSDYNNDGDVDIVAVRGNTLVRVLGNGNGTFAAAATAALAQTPCRIRSFDVDGDGNQDFIIGNQGTSLDIYRGQGNGNFSEAVGYNLPGVCDINAGDFNGDGALDIVYAGDGGVYLMVANP